MGVGDGMGDGVGVGDGMGDGVGVGDTVSTGCVQAIPGLRLVTTAVGSHHQVVRL